MAGRRNGSWRFFGNSSRADRRWHGTNVALILAFLGLTAGLGVSLGQPLRRTNFWKEWGVSGASRRATPVATTTSPT